MAETKRVIYYDQLSGNQPTNGDVIFVDNPNTGTHKMDLKSFVDAINNGFDSSIKSSGVSVSVDNYSSIITNVNDQPVNSIYTYGAGLQSKVTNLPSNKAMTIVNFAQKSTGGLGQVMLAVERNGSDDYLYFRTIGGSPAVWSSWVKVANNSDVEAVREALDNLDVETDKSLSIDGKPADAKAAGDEISDIKADLSDLMGIRKLLGMPVNKKWVKIGNPVSYIIQMNGGEKLHLKGGERVGYYSALTQLPSGTIGESVYYSIESGWTDRIALAANVVVESTLPTDAKYLLFVYEYANNIIFPSEIIINGYDYTKNIYDNFQIFYDKYDANNEQIYKNIAELSKFDNDLIDEKSNDLCQLGTIEEKTYYNPSNTGIPEANNSMFSVVDIPISDYIITNPYIQQKLFTYSSYRLGNNEYSARCINFYDSTGNWISGDTVYANPNKVKIGTLIPTNASKANVTFYYDNSTYPNKPETYWVYTQRVLNEYNAFDSRTKVLVKSIIDIDADNHADFLSVRKPTICFTLDGNYPRTQDIIDIAEEHGYKIGIAPKWNSSFIDYPGTEACYFSVENFLNWQANGHEIMTHLGFDLPDTGLTDSDCIKIIRQAYMTSVERGFRIKGAVASSGKCEDRFIPYVNKWFSYGSTQPNHAEYLGTRPDLLFKTAQTDKLWRYSMQSSTLTALKQAVDDAIANTGLVIFYGHAQSSSGISPKIFEDFNTYGDDPNVAGSTTNLSDTDHFTNDNFDALLTYIDTKVSNGDCVVNIPYYAINDYFKVRKTDFNWG